MEPSEYSYEIVPFPQIKPSDVESPVDNLRQDYKDIPKLAKLISTAGLLQPPAIIRKSRKEPNKYKAVFGNRRLRSLYMLEKGEVIESGPNNTSITYGLPKNVRWQLIKDVYYDELPPNALDKIRLLETNSTVIFNPVEAATAYLRMAEVTAQGSPYFTTWKQAKRNLEVKKTIIWEIAKESPASADTISKLINDAETHGTLKSVKSISKEDADKIGITVARFIDSSSLNPQDKTVVAKALATVKTHKPLTPQNKLIHLFTIARQTQTEGKDIADRIISLSNINDTSNTPPKRVSAYVELKLDDLLVKYSQRVRLSKEQALHSIILEKMQKEYPTEF